MWGRVEQYSPGKWRLRGSWNKRQYAFYKYVDGKSLFDERLAFRLQERISSEIDSKTFDPRRYLKNNPFSFIKASKIWLDNSHCSNEWKKVRERIIEKIFIPFFGSMDIRDIQSIHIEEFYFNLKKNTSWTDKTIYNIMGELRAMLRNLSDDLIKIPSFPRLSYQVPAIRIMTYEQQENVFEFIPDNDKPIFLFWRNTGCRPSEARGLLRENIFKEEGYLILSMVAERAGQIKPNTKTKRVKVFPITPEIEEAIKPRYLGRFVFMHFDLRHKKYKPYSRTILWRIWTKANKEAHEKYGISIINPYNAFRHSFACQKLAEGIPIDGVQQMLGHTNIKTTQRYGQYDLEKLKEWMRPNLVKISHDKKAR